MRTLSAKSPEKQRITSLETMSVYAPLAHRLGMQKINQELENLSLMYLDPIGYEEIKRNIETKYGQNKDSLEKARKQISDALGANNIRFSLDGRVKSVYSTYKKMYEQNKQFDEIYDFYALRVIVDTELECYSVLGIIHDMFRSVPGRFKDYISTPKPNLYRSLHTTVIGKDGLPFEVQIRTWEMHQIAQYGVAAHWKYKSGERSKEEIDKKLSWIASLIENGELSSNNEEFMDMLKIDMFHDETFVFTPKGDVITLPQGSTVIDFAYAIHSAVGNRMIGAKINGMIVPIDRVPNNGEIIEILTSSASKGPSRDWLKIVRTSEARNKIRQYFKKERRPENIVVGRNEIDKEFKKYGRAYTDEQKNEILMNVSSRLGIRTVDDLYNTIGFGGLTVSKIAAKLRDEFDRVVKVGHSQAPTIADMIATSKLKNRGKGGVVVDGVEDCQVKFAKCCNPLPGDSIIGFITKGFGISIHKRDCPNVQCNMLLPEYNDRWVSAYWDIPEENRAGNGLYEAMLKIYVSNRENLILDITTVLSNMKVSLLQISTQIRSGDGALINISIGCRDLEHYSQIVASLKKVPGVNDIVRGYS